MSDYSKINFSEDYELNHILSYQWDKKETEENREILRRIGTDYKYDRDVKIVTNRIDFYNYAEGHTFFSVLEDK